jgi:hypothetical protein
MSWVRYKCAAVRRPSPAAVMALLPLDKDLLFDIWNPRGLQAAGLEIWPRVVCLSYTEASTRRPFSVIIAGQIADQQRSPPGFGANSCCNFEIPFNTMSSVTIPFGDNASVVGTAVDPSVNRFTGIPFALPPVGPSRWKRPVKLPANYFESNSPYDATKFKDLCLQPPSPLPHDPSQHPNVDFIRNEANSSIRKTACM